MSIKEEWEATIKELQAVYLEISSYYKKMSKVNDEHSWGIIQSGIDQGSEKAMELRKKCMELRGKYFAEWEATKNNSSN